MKQNCSLSSLIKDPSFKHLRDGERNEMMMRFLKDMEINIFDSPWKNKNKKLYLMKRDWAFLRVKTYVA